MPPIRDGVPVKWRSTSSGARPRISKICAPQYDGIVEMPIFDIVLSRPLAMPLTARRCGLLGAHVQLAALGEVGERLEHQVRVDGRGAVADEDGDAVHAARLARLDDEAGLEARALADEVVVNRGDGERRRDRAPAPGPTVRSERIEDVGAVGERGVGLAAQALERRLHPGRAVGTRPT